MTALLFCLAFTGLALFFLAQSLASHAETKLESKLSSLSKPVYEPGDTTQELPIETVNYFRRMAGKAEL